MTGVRRIDPVFIERVWGRTDLSPLYGPQKNRIGEVWFPLGDHYPLLVKFIFTSERLSIQVHPDDAFAELHEGSRGKTEMWHILAAEPGATIALGMKQPVTEEILRSSIGDGSVVDLLNWVPVTAGDTLFAPAGMIHAIGAGIMLCEIQQNSDITYRLFDYGRPRELHLEKGLAVSNPCVFEGRRTFPVECDHFVTELLNSGESIRVVSDREYLLIPVSGEGMIHSRDFSGTFAAGECWAVDPNAGEIQLAGEPGMRLLRTYAV